MEENFLKVKNFSSEDVLSFTAGLCKAAKIIEQLKVILTNDLSPELSGRLNKKVGFLVMPKFNLFEQGINCELLKIGAKAWQKGKIRIKITLEFCPDETEKSLPEIEMSETFAGQSDNNKVI